MNDEIGIGYKAVCSIEQAYRIGAYDADAGAAHYLHELLLVFDPLTTSLSEILGDYDDRLHAFACALLHDRRHRGRRRYYDSGIYGLGYFLD